MEIKEIKERLTILSVLQHYNLSVNQSNCLKCPFHESKSSKKTMQVYTDTNRYQCFEKSCSAGNGDVLDFIEKKEKCSKHAAIEKAKDILGIKSAHPDDGRNQHGETIQVPVAGFFDSSSAEKLTYIDENLEITALGGIKLEGLDRMRGTLKVTKGHLSIRQNLDLYSDGQVQKLVRLVAERLEVGTSKTETALNNLIDHLENYRLEMLEARKGESGKEETKQLTEEERKAAIQFLKSPDLMERTNKLLGKSGIIGEEINRQILWLVYGSRKRPDPLHVICLGASGTGKSYLQEKVARFVNDDEKFTFTASTENAFYYLEPYDLCHKVVLIEDMDGVQSLLYPLRELQTKHWISKIVALKDNPNSVTNKTRKLEIYGPICLSGTTTKERLYEDNANRCLLLHLDDSEQQEEAIMDYQRKLSAGKVDKDSEQETTKLLTNVQQTLQKIKVINPYAESLKIPSKCFKPLRTNAHYLQFIETVTWYHQYQRDEKVDKETGEVFIESTVEDIETANRLMRDILLTKSDELPKATRQFFEGIKEWMKQEGKTSFTSKTLRNHFRLYPMKANRLLKTLEQYGYLKRVGGNKKLGYEYEVVDWDDYSRLKGNVDVLDSLLLGLENSRNDSK